MCQKQCTPRRCWNTFQRILSRFRAFTARVIFCSFSILVVASLAKLKEDYKYWLLILSVLPMVGETIITFNNYQRRKSAGKWFSPVVFLFLCSACPSIWMMRLHLVMDASKITSNVTTQADMDPTFLLSANPRQRCKVLEQMLLLVLIVGRWLLPRAGISRDQLSQLLLVNIGMAADIIELFEAFREDAVRDNPTLTIIILGIWQASLIQFALAKTATRSRRPATTEPNVQQRVKNNNCLFCETDLWAITISLALQDVPFLSLRMVLIFSYSIVSYSNVFFTLKNTLVIILQLFRFFVILIEHSYRKSLSESPGGKATRHTFSFMFEQQGKSSRPSSTVIHASDGSLVGNSTIGGEPGSGSRNPMLLLSRRLLKALSRSNPPMVEKKPIFRAPSPLPPVIYKPPIWRKRRRPGASTKLPSRIHPPELPTISFIPKRRSSTQALRLSREMRRRAYRSLSPARQALPPVPISCQRSWHAGEEVPEYRDDSECLLKVSIDKHHVELQRMTVSDMMAERGFIRHMP